MSDNPRENSSFWPYMYIKFQSCTHCSRFKVQYSNMALAWIRTLSTLGTCTEDGQETQETCPKGAQESLLRTLGTCTKGGQETRETCPKGAEESLLRTLGTCTRGGRETQETCLKGAQESLLRTLGKCTKAAQESLWAPLIRTQNIIIQHNTTNEVHDEIQQQQNNEEPMECMPSGPPEPDCKHKYPHDELQQQQNNEEEIKDCINSIKMAIYKYEIFKDIEDLKYYIRRATDKAVYEFLNDRMSVQPMDWMATARGPPAPDYEPPIPPEQDEDWVPDKEVNPFA